VKPASSLRGEQFPKGGLAGRQRGNEVSGNKTNINYYEAGTLTLD